MRKKLQSAGFVLCVVLVSVGATLLIQRWGWPGRASKSIDVESESGTLQTLTFLDVDRAESAEVTGEDREGATLVQAQVLQRQLAEQAARVDEIVRDEAGNWAQFVDENGLGVSGRVLVGAPGLWPYETLGTTSDGVVRLPSVDVTTLARNQLYSYELLARSDDPARQMAFWGEYQSPPPTSFENGLVEEAKIEMVGAADVRFRIVDEEDQPVAGAFVRLSRDSVGLLHLTFTSGPDGQVVFARLPPGTYGVTVNADGFARAVFDVTHDLEAPEHVVTLGEGSSSRRPLSWRQNPDAAPRPSGATAQGSSEPTGSGPATESSDASQAASEEQQASKRRLRVFVVDDYGAPVVGAYVEVWAGTRREVSGTSKGHQPLELPVSHQAARIVAIYPGMGEGELSLPAGGEEEADEQGADRVITLNMRLFSSGAVPGRIHQPGQVEALLGVELIDVDGAWLFDVIDPEMPAGQAGILRGDSLLSLRRTSTGFEAVVSRGGQVRRIVI